MKFSHLILALIIVAIIIFLLSSGFDVKALIIIGFALALIDSFFRRDVVRILIGIVAFLVIYFISSPIAKYLDNLFPPYELIGKTITTLIVSAMFIIPIYATSSKGWLTSIGLGLLTIYLVFIILEPLQRSFLTQISAATNIPLHFIVYLLAILAGLIVIFKFPKR